MNFAAFFLTAPSGYGTPSTATIGWKFPRNFTRHMARYWVFIFSTLLWYTSSALGVCPVPEPSLTSAIRRKFRTIQRMKAGWDLRRGS